MRRSPVCLILALAVRPGTAFALLGDTPTIRAVVRLRRRLLRLAAALALAVAGPPFAAQAATFVVNSTADAVDAAPGDGSCATAGAVCTLRAAIQEANALAGGDAITLPAGTYVLTLAGVGEDAGATGDLDVTSGPLTITGAGAASTVVDGGAIDRVLHLPFFVSRIGLTDLTIRNGTAGNGGGIASAGQLFLLRVVVRDNAAGNAGGIGHGGTADLPLVLTDSTVTNNTATQNAGGIGQSGALTLDNSTISDNVAGTGSGGGISSNGSITATGGVISGNTAPTGGGIFNDAGTVDVVGATITGNTATEGSGGGLITSAGTVTLTDTVLSTNQASNTGGGLAQGMGTVTLVGCTVAGNSASNGGGGIGGGDNLSVASSLVMDNTAPFGAGIASGTATVITATTVSGNDASVSGGGILNGGGSVNVAGSLISGNTAVQDGAGIFIQTGASLTLQDTTVSGNQAGLLGGGLRNGGTSTLERVTLSGNSAAEGGGVYAFGGDASLTNVTLSGNSAASGGGIYANGDLSLNNGTVTANTATTGNGGGLGGYFITLRNSIVAANADTGGEAPDCSLNVISAGYNLIGSTAGCSFVPDAGDQTGVAAGLGPLGDNGGPTATHALLAGSLALDAGNPAGCTGAGGSPLTTDQRGFPRPLDGGTGVVRCDVGAFERFFQDLIFADGFEPT